ncbi:hypothetical protein [Psychrobacter sp. K31L]|uniref:hypothetical protein n=1 Tax=Psychrobacter sp. K31L TaxID=2820758 RepID=UPI001B31E5BF|nr:hypothetical protein [Psychrobacter sp. K31L]MBP3945115.1 hypothetical protein [Psychrobacter sp. K31L]
MANSEDIIRLYVKREQRKGTPDGKIVVGITKLEGQAGKDANKMVKALRDAGLSPTESLADYFGLKTGAVDPKAKKPVNKNPSIGQKAKSYATSAALGLSDAGAGIVQGMALAADGVNKGINSVAGTNYKTDAYEEYNDDYKAANANANAMRADAGRGGGDFVRGGTELGATVPMFLAGGGAGAGVKAGAAFAGRQAAIGAGVGAARYAENGKQRVGNTAGGAIGGAVGGVIGEKVVAPAIGKAVGAVARRTANKTGTTAAAAERMVDDLISREDMVVGEAVRRNIVVEATKNLSKGKQVDAAALARQSLLKQYNLKGTKAQISRDPIEWKNEVELAKNNPELNDVRIQNHDQVRSTWQSLADDTNARPVDNNARMESTFQTLKQSDEVAQDNIKSLYGRAREMGGNDVQLNHMRFIDQASRELEEQGLGSFLKGDIRGVFKGMFDNPDFVLTHGKSEEIVKILNARLKTTTDGNERAALAIVRKNLDNEVGQSIDELGGAARGADNAGSTDLSNPDQFAGDGLAGARGAWQEARGAARDRFQNIDSNPLLKDALDEKPVDKMFDKYVLRGNERDLVKLVDDLKQTPQGQQNIADLQGATIEHFIAKASRGNDGAFSPAGLNNAIKSFGDNRMKALFTPEQISRINDVKQVSDILLQQPRGSAVNHSNTASAIIPFLQGIVGRVPVGGNLLSGAVGTAAKKVTDINASGAAAKAMNGQAGVTKGSSLGLTDEQLEMLGMIPKRSGQVGAGLGANIGD